MRQWLTGEDLFNWLGMLRTTDARSFVVLEGPTDCQALDPHVDDRWAATFPAHAKSVPKRALELIDQRGLSRVLVVLDRDWVDQFEARVSSANVVYTDDYDLDASIVFAGDVLSRVVSAHSDRDMREAHLASLGINARELTIKLVAPVGVLRYVSERDRLEIRCQRFPLHQAMTAGHDSVDLQNMCVIAIGRSQQATVGVATLSSLIQSELTGAIDLRWFCSGHDLATGLSAVIKYWGGSSSRIVVEQALRSAFSCADLKATHLYRGVLAWCASSGATVWSCA
jgi:hypothetical protein